MMEWTPAYKLFWDSVRRENPYDPQKPFRWLDPLVWRMNSGKQTTLMMLQEQDRMNFNAQRLLDNKTYCHNSYESIEAHILISGIENRNLRCYNSGRSKTKWLSFPRRFGKTNMLLAELKERQYLRQLQPTLFVPRNFYATDVRIPLERKVLTDLAFKNWW